MTPRILVGGRLWLGVLTVVALSMTGLCLRMAVRGGCHSHHAGLAEPAADPRPHGLAGDMLRRHGEDVQFCEMEARGVGPTFQGHLALHVSVRPDGSVSEALVRPLTPVSSTQEASTHVLQGCVEAAAYSWSFPFTGNAYQVTLPITVR